MLGGVLTSSPAVGVSAGWHLAFCAEQRGTPVVEISSQDHDGEIQAALPAGLEGGQYQFVVEGMSSDDYGKIAPVGKNRPGIVRLYLFWRDTSGITALLGSLASLGGGPTAQELDQSDALVAVLAVEAITRRAGKRNYETVITASEHVYNVLAQRRLTTAVRGGPANAIDDVLNKHAGFGDFTDHGTANPLAPVSTPPDDVLLERGLTAADAVAKVVARLEEAHNVHGRGLLLIRNGKLEIGTRNVPLTGSDKDLDSAGGLLNVQVLAPLATDPHHFANQPSRPAPTRRQFQLTLRGRPDLKPGDTVRFGAPPEEVPATGGLLSMAGDMLASLSPNPELANPVRLYVSSVQHRLGRTASFVTTLSGVEVPGKEWAWDSHSAPGPVPTEPDEADGTNAVTGLARAMTHAARREVRARAGTQIAEVRATTASGDDPPAQTEDLWRGLERGDGIPGQARRLAVTRPSGAPAYDVPYLTPFAWGQCGLVLPRYPGTRVAVVHRDGRYDDPIDVGALWEDGRVPDKAEAGDWWLILPVDVQPKSARSSLSDTDVPQDHSGKTIGDLIDADGNRVIEVGELTVRVGRSTLPAVGERPKRTSTADSITIEHTGKGATIVMDKDGKITITAKANLELNADGDIVMTAKNVTVDAPMEVK